MTDAREKYLEPEERLALRTEDVYQTDKDVDTLNYSDKLLEIVATFSNSGQPEGWSVQSMVGRSKRGEVALRLFAVVEPASERTCEPVDFTDPTLLSQWRFGSVRFKSRGCLAMTACASVVCDMIEGLTFEEALRITPEQIKDATGGVPWDKLHTPVFAVEAIRGLVGDWIIHQGATFDELEAVLPCDPMDPHCLMCEHCSLRAFRTDLRMDAILAKAEKPTSEDQPEDPTDLDIRADETADEQYSPEMQELLEHNALADVFDTVRSYSADSQLFTPDMLPDLELVPDFTTPDDFEMFIYEYLEGYRADHPLTRENHNKPADEQAVIPPEKRTSAHGFRSATKAVGIAPSIRDIMAAKRNNAQTNGEDTAVDEGTAEPLTKQVADNDSTDQSTIPAKNAVNDVVPVSNADAKVSNPNTDPTSESNPYSGLRLPKGYEMVQLENGEWAMAAIPPDRMPDRREVHCEDIVALTGQYTYYLYDRSKMTDSYAHWAFLAAEDDPLVTFADLVREDSRTYPRPMAQHSLHNEPFSMTDEAVEEAYNLALRTEGYEDIQRTVASNGDVYYFSTTYLSPRQAEALAEWASVERVANP